MADLEKIELARAMHERGVNALTNHMYGRLMHPLGGLAAAHGILVITADDQESLFTAYKVLDKRLEVLEPEQIREENPAFIEDLRRGSRRYSLDEERINQALWITAWDLIRQPVAEKEVTG